MKQFAKEEGERSIISLRLNTLARTAGTKCEGILCSYLEMDSSFVIQLGHMTVVVCFQSSDCKIQS